MTALKKYFLKSFFAASIVFLFSFNFSALAQTSTCNSSAADGFTCEQSGGSWDVNSQSCKCPTQTSTSNSGSGSSQNCGGDSRFEFKNGMCLPKSNYDSKSLASSSKLMDVILSVINTLLLLAGVIAVGAIVVGGFWYITAAGNDEQSEKGKSALINAVIGLVIIIMAYAIVNVIVSTLTSANPLSKTS